MSAIETGLQAVRARIVAAAAAAGRHPTDIELVAVSKSFPPQAVLDAVDSGQRTFGENYAQEGVTKILAVRNRTAVPLTWHFIGPIQSNKTRLIAEQFDWVQSVDRLNIAKRLSQQRPPALGELQLCIQVNISREASKQGVEPQALPELARQVCALPRLRLRGLMAIPEPGADVQQAQQLRAMRELWDALRARGIALDTLSMGMSEDLELAIAEGATMVRVGRAIFGERPVRMR